MPSGTLHSFVRWACGAVLVASGLLSLSAQAPASESDAGAIALARTGLEAWQTKRQAVLRDDWGELARYRQENRFLPPPKADEPRVVFLGDSITDVWSLAKSFPGRPYINRGISGQTTGQMLVRFRSDVIDLKPRAVFILAGTNDIAGNTGPATEPDILANLTSMGDLAKVNGIKVVFCSVLPVHNQTPEARDFFAERPMGRIRALNQGLQALCKAKGFGYLDAYTAMLDGSGFLRLDLAGDGLHPNEAGYRVLSPLVEGALRSILAKD